MTMQAWSPDPGGTNYGLKARMPITPVNAVSRGISANVRADLQDTERHPQRKLRVGIIQIKPADLLRLMQPVDDAIPMKIQCLCRLFYTAAVFWSCTPRRTVLCTKRRGEYIV